MNISTFIKLLIVMPAHLFNLGQDVMALLLRFYVGWQFFNAGLLKISSWENTLFLFEHEYRVPVLSPFWGALTGAAGELIFPILLWFGLTSRLASLGMQAVNIMAVVAYAHVIFNPEFGTGAAADHYLWGLMLLVLMIYGPGKISIDYLLTGRTKATGSLAVRQETQNAIC